jgi:hypothetical protein
MNWRLKAGRGGRSWAKGIRFGSGVLAVAVTAGCATMGGGLTKDTPPEAKAAAVKERSNARWEALIKGDKDAAYGYLSPATREIVTLEQYRARLQAISYTAVHVEKVDCDAETCEVGLMLTYDYLPAKGTTRAKGVTTYVQETWVLDKGQAWFAWRP